MISLRSMNPGVYLIQNTITHWVYIGSSTQLDLRFRVHKRLLERNKHENKALQRDWNDYGQHVFITKVLDQVDAEEVRHNTLALVTIEDGWIKYYHHTLGRELYNVRPQARTYHKILCREDHIGRLNAVGEYGYKRPQWVKELMERAEHFRKERESSQLRFALPQIESEITESRNNG